MGEKKIYEVERYDFVNLGGVILHEEAETLEEAKELALREFLNLSDKEKKTYEILVIETNKNDETEETVEIEDMIIPFALNNEKIDEKIDEVYEHIVDVMSNHQANDGSKYNYIDCEINDYVEFIYDYDDKIIQNLIIEDVIDTIKEDELEELEDIKTELEEELLNEEFTLREVDNIVNEIMYTQSAFETFLSATKLLQAKRIKYYYSDNHSIKIEFEKIEDNLDTEYTIIKVKNISIN